MAGQSLNRDIFFQYHNTKLASHLLHELKLDGIMDSGQTDVLHRRENTLQHCSGDHAAALGDDEGQEAIDVDGLTVHDVGIGHHLDYLAERVAVVHAARDSIIIDSSKTIEQHSGDYSWYVLLGANRVSR